jgi:DNA transposition AAA+ family ATPase
MSKDAAQAWNAPKQEPEIDADQLTDWQMATRRLAKVAGADGLTRSEVSRRSDIPLGTFSAWYDGTYNGSYKNTTARVVRWLDAVEEQKSNAFASPEAPEWVETRTAKELWDTLVYAQMMPEIAVVTLGAGMGKTTTSRRYIATRPNAFLVTMRPTTAGKHSMLQELAMALDVIERNPARLDRAIGHRLQRNGRHTLLIVDEAQNLKDDAADQLRYFHDEYGCGIALLGNDEVASRFGRKDPRKGQAQFHRRVGKRIERLTPLPEDIEALIDAWNLEDADARKLLRAVGNKPGALGQIDKTARLASMFAMGRGSAIEASDIRAAWRDRAGETI